MTGGKRDSRCGMQWKLECRRREIDEHGNKRSGPHHRERNRQRARSWWRSLRTWIRAKLLPGSLAHIQHAGADRCFGDSGFDDGADHEAHRSHSNFTTGSTMRDVAREREGARTDPGLRLLHQLRALLPIFVSMMGTATFVAVFIDLSSPTFQLPLHSAAGISLPAGHADGFLSGSHTHRPTIAFKASRDRSCRRELAMRRSVEEKWVKWPYYKGKRLTPSAPSD